MGPCRGFLLLAICAVVLFQCVSAHKHHGHKRELAVKRATFNVTLDGTDSTETTADILTRLKLLAYAEKLKAKEAKKKVKADKKAAKEKAWNAYLTSLIPPPAAPGAPGAAGAPGTAGTAPAPILPPAMGLWKKSFLLSQLAAAQAQAAAAAAAAEATTPAGSETAPVDDTEEEE